MPSGSIFGDATIVSAVAFAKKTSTIARDSQKSISRQMFDTKSTVPVILMLWSTKIKSKMDVEFALLLCRQEVAPVYVRLGWMLVDGPTTFWQPAGEVTYPKLTMVLECGKKSWPTGPIDLGGLPW